MTDLDTNPELEAAIRAVAAGGGNASRSRLYQLLLNSLLIAPTWGNAPAGLQARTYVGGDQVQFITGRNRAHEPAVIVFTGLDALRLWKPTGSAFLAVQSRELFGLALKNSFSAVIINPAGPAGGELSRIEIGILAEGGIPDVEESSPVMTHINLPAGSKIVIGAPASPPSEDLVELLRDRLADYPGIKGAYLYQTAIASGIPHLSLGLEFSSKGSHLALDEVAPGLSRAVAAFLSDNEVLDVIELDDNSLRTVRKYVHSIL